MSNDASDNGSHDERGIPSARRSLRHINQLISSAPYVMSLGALAFVASLFVVPRSAAFWITAGGTAGVTFPLAWRHWRTRPSALGLWLVGAMLLLQSVAQTIFLAPLHGTGLSACLQFCSIWVFATLALVVTFRERLRSSLSHAILDV